MEISWPRSHTIHSIDHSFITTSGLYDLNKGDSLANSNLTLFLQKNHNDIYVSMVKSVLNTPFFYFSYTYDLSHTLQRLHSTSPDFKQLGLAERADQRFIWNRHILKEFQKLGLKRFCLPLILGCEYSFLENVLDLQKRFLTFHIFFLVVVSINTVRVNNHSFTWALISRRMVHRAGTRFFSRGIDKDVSFRIFKRISDSEL